MSDAADSSSSSSGAVHPVVMSSSSNYMTLEVGSYAFYDDLEIYATSEESAVMMKASWMLASVIALIMVSFN